jgi:hypothetical protein
MKVSKKSWHYKWVDTVWVETYIPHTGNNLCKYFWMLVWSITAPILIALFVCFILFGVGYTLFMDGIHWGFFNIGIALFMLSLFIIPIIAISAFRKYISNDTAIHTPTLLSEFIRAKKDKVCPMIDFED